MTPNFPAQGANCKPPRNRSHRLRLVRDEGSNIELQLPTLAGHSGVLTRDCNFTRVQAQWPTHKT